MHNSAESPPWPTKVLGATPFGIAGTAAGTPATIKRGMYFKASKSQELEHTKKLIKTLPRKYRVVQLNFT